MVNKVSAWALAIALSVSACASHDSTSVKSMQRKDKKLTCKEILLEMNEAEFYKNMAQKNKGPNLKNVLMPLGYISTYMNAEEAIGSSQARIDYLDRIYQIMDCDESSPQATPMHIDMNPGAYQSLGNNLNGYNMQQNQVTMPYHNMMKGDQQVELHPASSPNQGQFMSREW